MNLIERNYGWKPQEKDVRDYKFSLTKANAKLPTSVDLRAKMPTVYDQGSLGSCTANAIAALIQNRNKTLSPSRLFIYYNERMMENTVSEDAGAVIRDGIKSVNQTGVCSEQTLPYNVSKFAEKPSDHCFSEANNNKSDAYYAVNQTELDLKSALALGYPIAFGFMVKASFESEEVAKSGIYLPKSREKQIGGHAVCIIGYHDELKQFLVRNSWGQKWGVKGYFWMPYAEVLNPKISNDFWVISAMKAIPAI